MQVLFKMSQLDTKLWNKIKNRNTVTKQPDHNQHGNISSKNITLYIVLYNTDTTAQNNVTLTQCTTLQINKPECMTEYTVYSQQYSYCGCCKRWNRPAGNAVLAAWAGAVCNTIIIQHLNLLTVICWFLIISSHNSVMCMVKNLVTC